jgi:hypothetical protein
MAVSHVFKIIDNPGKVHNRAADCADNWVKEPVRVSRRVFNFL